MGEQPPEDSTSPLAEAGTEAEAATLQDMQLPTLPSPESRSPSPGPVLTQQPKSGHCVEQERDVAAQHDDHGQIPMRSGSSSPSPSHAGPPPGALLASPLTHPNGASMFPSMSTSEQEDMAREALSQAEASIVAENFEDELGGDDGSDGGYSSDGFSSGSTSAESSVRDYLYENGRRYHRFREGAYNFPNDDVEQEREDMKHAMVKLLCSQRLHFAPIGDHPQEVLDIGTGTGIWAIEMGDQFPSAHVLGIDLSPIQPDWLPPNVRFLVDDVESPWLYPVNHFDYIHSRHTVMAVRDWARLFRRAYEHLKPGGWIELQEIHHKPRSAHADGIVPADHAVAMFWARVNEGLTTLGIDLDTAGGGVLSQMMRDAGFTNVTERVFHVPIGTWPKNKVLKTVGLYWRTILLDGLQAIALGPLTRGLRWNREQVELFLMEVRRAYNDNSALMYMPLHIIYAQKPENVM
ncbi:Methyltransferase type 12 [Ophiocordyceps sinensis CO18]|nr:Methyltransferase type 12 [Ophiocordyceps sinensis CO18]